MLKSNEVKDEIPGVTNLATTAAFTTVENKIPNFNDLLKKNRLWCKNIRNGKKYFSTSYYNKFTSNTLDAKITQKKLKWNQSGSNKKIKTVIKEEIERISNNAKIKSRAR